MGQLGHDWARYEGYQSKPATVQYHAGPGRPADRLTQPRPSMIILIRVVSVRRHDGPVVPDWTQTCKQKNSKIQKIKGNIQTFLDSIGYTYNFRYIFRKNNFRYK